MTHENKLFDKIEIGKFIFSHKNKESQKALFLYIKLIFR